MLMRDSVKIRAQGCGSTGVVMRDSTGGFIAAANRFLPHALDTQTAEAFALKGGLDLAKMIGSNRFIIQSDCMAVVDTIRDGGFSATAAAAIYEECYSEWRDLADVSIEHCHREANEVAHLLANVALNSRSTRIWLDGPPSFIVAGMATDVTILLNE
ncbi:hypothetical protein QOZ80_8BG0657540 [Eleusine coracana subsp. coracana]|nr:hypothetical protein QOZ80_8BG0657540 [Eleusine coracana subsp. coracana]